jgi:hypothetical protein
MTEYSAYPQEEEGEVRDENDPGEVGTSFQTKGKGWSGRDSDEDDDES